MGSPMPNKNGKKAAAPEKSGNDKWKYTLYTTVIFLVVINPLTYKIVDGVLGRFVKIASSTGCPTTAGMLVHALVFTLVLRYMMDLNL